MGDRIFFPNSAQFDTMNENLAKIAGVLGSQIDVTTWKGVQKAVRAGVAPDLFPIGTQLRVSHSVYGDMQYDVVAHDYFKSAHDGNAHTMTLMCHNSIGQIQYDAAEAMWTGNITVHPYKFTVPETVGSWDAGTYTFATTIFQGDGAFVLSGDVNTPMENLIVSVYDLENQVKETAVIYKLPDDSSLIAINLGTLGVELNHPHRMSQGSNNYKESAIRQFLNSSAEAGKVWTPQTKFDRPPSWADTLAGFANGLDDEFLSCVGEVIVPCSANNIYESLDSTTAKGEKYTVTDKFYLASQREIFGIDNETVVDESALFPFYAGATDTDRIKYRDGARAYWWTRSAISWGAYGVRVVGRDGTLGNGHSYDGTGIVPVCTIV